MAELKTLNGYEIVDQNARDTKQNKVLYGESDPSNTLGSNGDLYIATNGADVINDLQSQINDNKNYIDSVSYHSPWTRNHFTVKKSGSALTVDLTNRFPIDCGLAIISFRCTNNNSGGVVILSVGYFLSILSTNTHNEVTGVTVSGDVSNGVFNISSIGNNDNGNVLVTILYPEFNYMR